MRLWDILKSHARSLISDIKVDVLKIKPDPMQYTTMVGRDSIVPCQQEAYFMAVNQYVDPGAKVLDVGFGLGYGLTILSIKADEVHGVDIDPKVLEFNQMRFVGRNPKLKSLSLYDGYHLDFPDNHFDLITSVDVLEHVPDFDKFLEELLRVSRKGVFISTPNRRPEYTNADGTPKNYWHLREWTHQELDAILRRHSARIEWNFLNGPFDGPFTYSDVVMPDTLTLTPMIFK